MEGHSSGPVSPLLEVPLGTFDFSRNDQRTKKTHTSHRNRAFFTPSGFLLTSNSLPPTLPYAAEKNESIADKRDGCKSLKITGIIRRHLLFAIDDEDDINLVFQLKNMVEVYAGNPVPLTHTGGELRRRESN